MIIVLIQKDNEHYYYLCFDKLQNKQSQTILSANVHSFQYWGVAATIGYRKSLALVKQTNVQVYYQVYM